MPDDKSKRGGPDRKRVAGEQAYEVIYFAGKHSLSVADARRIIADAGPSRAKADAAARRLKGRPRTATPTARSVARGRDFVLR